LIVTNAGGNFFSVYEPRRSHFGLNWSQISAAQTTVGDDQTFQAINGESKMEGGPKDLTVHGNMIAVCSPELESSFILSRKLYHPTMIVG